MVETLPDTRDGLLARMHEFKWVHCIDVGGGVKTPGVWGDGNPSQIQAMHEIDFRGRKVLDIGCWDGKWSFEAERLGAAEVYATDILSQRWPEYQKPTFELARRLLGSRVKHYPDVSVYEVERLGIRDFDVVLYTGIYYHIRDPLRAFSCLRRVMKEGGVILVEGAIVDGTDECYAKFYYNEQFCGDNSNWWVPTVPCLRQWVESSYFEVFKEYGKWNAGHSNTRYTLTARAVRRHDPKYVFPDPDLGHFQI